ncbi:MAG: peptide chain release factor N(5)-glutamine methyltransferase [Ruminococcaceae bacterium]|nr:peptide chain release factor N(5)-glutamine methyltransferase [Oscillospiraceae bacterium]
MTLSEAIERLRMAGVPDAEHDARAIFRHFGGFRGYELVSRSVSSDEPQLTDAIRRREGREPLQYIIGECDFYRERYFVSRDCLIPRSDTEILVDFAVKNLPSGARFIDLCTGSGCVALSVLNNTADTTALAVDISVAALEIAEKNAKRLGLDSRVEIREGDALGEAIGGEVDAVLSNPPYVTDGEYTALEKEIYFEPKGAFVGGSDGGDFYRAITENYKNSLKKGGFIAYEIGAEQAELLSKIAEDNGMSCEIINDLGGRARLAVLKNPL